MLCLKETMVDCTVDVFNRSTSLIVSTLEIVK